MSHPPGRYRRDPSPLPGARQGEASPPLALTPSMIPPSISTVSPSMIGGGRSGLSQSPLRRRWDPGRALQTANPRRSSPPGAAHALAMEACPSSAPLTAAVPVPLPGPGGGAGAGAERSHLPAWVGRGGSAA